MFPAEKILIINEKIIKDKNWLIGFTDAEGCFYIKINHNYVITLTFSISQHIRDISLLKQFSTYFNCGMIEQVKTRPNQCTAIGRLLIWRSY